MVLFLTLGYDPLTSRRIYKSWGNYKAQCGYQTGEMWMRFEDNKQRHLLVIPVAGYPLNKGIRIELDQNGHQKKLVLDKNPKESWCTVYTKVENGSFNIHVTNLGATAWVAIGAPFRIGALDLFINWLLSNWALFIMFGLSAGVLLMIIGI